MILTLLGLLGFGVLVGAWLPALAASQEASNHVASQPLYSADAELGREIYLAEGCSTCHTMSVRSLEVDAGLGLITEPEDIANFFESLEGVRRIGPDLAHIGERMEAGDINAFISNPTFVQADAHHPPYKYLSADEIDDLTTFLSETK
jgi:cytochrome c oxidase cbb3-type subunit 2